MSSPSLFFIKISLYYIYLLSRQTVSNLSANLLMICLFLFHVVIANLGEGLGKEIEKWLDHLLTLISKVLKGLKTAHGEKNNRRK